MLTFEADIEIETKAEWMRTAEPKVYHAGDPLFPDSWIAAGTDGFLYVVPAEAGGWLRRADYRGAREELAPVCPEKARTIMWFVYGDIGPVTIVLG